MFRANADADDRVEIAILAKAPVAGQAKTRLISLLGADGAARLQGWLLARTVETAAAAGLGPIVLWCADQPDHPDFRRCVGSGKVSLQAQPEGDIGVRMLAAAAAAETPAGALIIGTDCPVLTPALLREAAAALNGHDAVVFPAEDGGYVLIGMRRPAPELFAGIEWGTGSVMARTREKLAGLGWSWAEPATLWDVDRPADYERLAAFAWPDGRRPF